MAGIFESRTHINGNMLGQFQGQNVSIMLCVEDEAGKNLIGTTTDDKKITVNLSDSVCASRGDWVEVIGRPAGPGTIRSRETIQFGGDNIEFDKEAYNMMVLFMNNCKDIYRSG